MPEYARYALTGFGLLFFAIYLGAAIYSVRFHVQRDKRLEAAGIAVPGVAGLLVAGSAWLPPGYGWIVAILWILAISLIVFGRIAYEHLVFRGSTNNRAGPREP